jgi:hypothetical protein
MTTSSGQKRVDECEIYLSPKEWAIRLAQDMREHASEADFMKTAAQLPYREWPWLKPFFKLAEQAKEHHPGKSPEDHEHLVRLNEKLRTDFHALKKLINRTNKTIRNKAETVQLKAALKLSLLQGVILREAFGRTARTASKWIKKNNADADVETPSALKQLDAYINMSSPSLPSLIEMLADDLTMLVIDISSHKIAVHKVQEQYFDAQPILFRDIETQLSRAVKATTDAVDTLNAYLKTRTELAKHDTTHKRKTKLATCTEQTSHLGINLESLNNMAAGLVPVNEWMRNSLEDATADILQERDTGEHEPYLWRILGKRLEAL